MKLTQITEGAVPPGTLRYFQRNETDYTVNEDGTIDINHDFVIDSDTPADFPKINRVYGDFSMVGRPYGKVWLDVMPNVVDGNCKIEVGIHLSILSSNIPKSGNGKGHILITGEGYLDLDDDTLNGYKEIRIDVWISSGLKHLPRTLDTPSLRVFGKIDGIPSSITAIALVLKMHDGSELKGIHKQISTLNVSTVLVIAPYDTPLLGFFNIRNRNFKTFVFNVSNGFYTDEQVMQLGNILNRGIKQDKTIFEVQEDLIEAGFSRNAKL